MRVLVLRYTLPARWVTDVRTSFSLLLSTLWHHQHQQQNSGSERTETTSNCASQHDPSDDPSIWWGNLGDTACYRDCSVCGISSAESCNWFETRLNIENEINLGPATSRSECVQMVRSVSFLVHLLRVLIRITHITLATFSYPHSQEYQSSVSTFSRLRYRPTRRSNTGTRFMSKCSDCSHAWSWLWWLLLPFCCERHEQPPWLGMVELFALFSGRRGAWRFWGCDW